MVIKAENVTVKPEFVVIDNPPRIQLTRSNGERMVMTPESLDQAINEILAAKREQQDFHSLFGRVVDIGHEATVFIRVDEIWKLEDAPEPFKSQGYETFVFLNKDGIGIPSRASRENLAHRIAAVIAEMAKTS